MKKSILNIGTILKSTEQKMILGGRTLSNGDDDGPCCISVNNSGFSDCGYSVNQAQNLYNQSFTVGNSTVTGYCCASC